MTGIFQIPYFSILSSPGPHAQIGLLNRTWKCVKNKKVKKTPERTVHPAHSQSWQWGRLRVCRRVPGQTPVLLCVPMGSWKCQPLCAVSLHTCSHVPGSAADWQEAQEVANMF